MGSQLPTELELATKLDVSRVTVRQALQAAVEEGLVVRVPGKGTYVAKADKIARHQGFIGYVVPHLSHSFNVQILLGAESVFKAAGYRLIFCNSEAHLDEENRLLQNLEAEGVAGYAVQAVYADADQRYLSRLVATGVPVVLIDRSVPGVETNVVTSDHFAGGYAVVQHLIDQGYTDIAYLARPPLQLSSIAERLRAYQTAMTDAGLTPRPPFLVGAGVERGYFRSLGAFTTQELTTISAIGDFLRGRERPQAIVAMNDLHALLVMEAAQRLLGLSIPRDLALVGFDDLDFASTLQPALTSVAQEPFQLGSEAARMLLSRIQGEFQGGREIRLPTRLVVRESSIKPQRR